MTLSTSPSAIAELDRYESFRDRRRQAATAPRGPASFVWGDFVTDRDVTVEGASGLWSPLPAGAPGLLVRARAAEGITIGGSVVDGEAVLHANEEAGPSVAYFADGAEGVIFTYDGSKYALQVWNPGSAWASRFADISAYDYDPSWKVDASIVPVPAGRTVAIAHHRDPRPVEVPVVAAVQFERDGQNYELLATSGGDDQSGLFIHFRDSTNGSESYSAGRSVRLEPDGDRGVLDFNYATLLPCSFSLAWNCPLPPAQNLLSVAVRAGERNAVDAEGATLL